jgi:hypothetical protein
MEVPSRAASTVYVKNGISIVLGESARRGPFCRYRGSKKVGHYSACDAVPHAVLLNSSHYKRDLFYTDVKLFVDQG